MDFFYLVINYGYPVLQTFNYNTGYPYYHPVLKIMMLRSQISDTGTTYFCAKSFSKDT